MRFISYETYNEIVFLDPKEKVQCVGHELKMSPILELINWEDNIIWGLILNIECELAVECPSFRVYKLEPGKKLTLSLHIVLAELFTGNDESSAGSGKEEEEVEEEEEEEEEYFQELELIANLHFFKTDPRNTGILNIPDWREQFRLDLVTEELVSKTSHCLGLKFT
jgi:hypothetical protein